MVLYPVFVHKYMYLELVYKGNEKEGKAKLCLDEEEEREGGRGKGKGERGEGNSYMKLLMGMHVGNIDKMPKRCQNIVMWTRSLIQNYYQI